MMYTITSCLKLHTHSLFFLDRVPSFITLKIMSLCQTMYVSLSLTSIQKVLVSHTHTHIYYIHTHIIFTEITHTHVCSHTHNTYTHTHSHTCIAIPTHTCTHTRTHTFMHLIHTHISTPTHTFILVLDNYVIIGRQLAAVDTLHHQDQFVVRDVLIVDWDAANVVSQLNLDDQLATQVQ